jgi:beta-1,4-mannosyl-glycoprotein beta-1,4-N-acetylglucosaminyltransferase
VIFDVIPFFDEIDLLEIRVHTLAPFVDKFVISEYSTTFAGNPKDYNFEKYRKKFAEFEDRIIYLKNRQEKILTSFENDDFQKNSIRAAVLEFSKPGDFFFFGDVDEIPSPKGIVSAIKHKSDYVIQHFAQEVFYGFLNCHNYRNQLLSYMGDYPHVHRKKWLGTQFCSRTVIEKFELSELRHPARKSIGRRIPKGGWHFSYCGGYQKDIEDRLDYKIANNAHQEFNVPNVREEALQKLLAGQDFLGRKDKRKMFPGYRTSKFRLMNDLSFLPDYAFVNQERFAHLITVGK